MQHEIGSLNPKNPSHAEGITAWLRLANEQMALIHTLTHQYCIQTTSIVTTV